MPGAPNLTGSLKNGEGNAFLLQLCSNAESTEASTHNKGIVPLDPFHFLAFAAPKPVDEGSKKQGEEKEHNWQGEHSP